MTMLPRFPLSLHLGLRPRLHLCIASGHVRLDLLQPLRSTSVRMTWRMVWAYLRGQDHMYYRVVGSETVTSTSTSTINTHTLQATVQQALQQLERSSGKPLAGSALTVEVGPALARVGLLELESVEGGTSAPRLSAADLHAYAQAWVTHTWGLEPADYVIRCQPLQRGGQYLLVCVDCFVPTLLAQLCIQQGIRFSDCTPALVNALATAPATALGQRAGRAATSVSMSVLMEDAPGATHAPQPPGAGIAQWVVMDESGPLSVCRTWLGGASPALQDDEVTHLARRLCAQHQLPEATHVHRLVWPMPATSKTLGTTP